MTLVMYILKVDPVFLIILQTVVFVCNNERYYVDFGDRKKVSKFQPTLINMEKRSARVHSS